MKSVLLAVCKHGIYEFMALQTKTRRIFHARIVILRLFKSVQLSIEARGLSFANLFFFATCILPFQQADISRLEYYIILKINHSNCHPSSF